MKCREIELLLAEYAAGRLEEKERETVHAHLQTCPGCRHECSEIESLFGAAAPDSAARAEAPEGYFDTVWPSLYRRIQDKGLNRRRIPLLDRLRPLFDFRRVGVYRLVNLGLILVVAGALYLSYQLDQTPSAGKRGGTRLESLARKGAGSSPGTTLEERKVLDGVSTFMLSSSQKPLEFWGQYLNPQKQHQMYESFTDNLADALVMLDL